jgi:hypothetical protein
MPEMQEQFPAIAMDGGLSRPSMQFPPTNVDLQNFWAEPLC